MLSETDLPLCSLVGSVLCIGCFLTGTPTTHNFSVDFSTSEKLRVVPFSESQKYTSASGRVIGSHLQSVQNTSVC